MATLTKETPPAPGWWMASDGRFYAPELHPDYDPASDKAPVINDKSAYDPHYVPPTDDWWMASDGLYYPPELHADYKAPSAPDTPESVLADIQAGKSATATTTAAAAAAAAVTTLPPKQGSTAQKKRGIALPWKKDSATASPENPEKPEKSAKQQKRAVDGSAANKATYVNAPTKEKKEFIGLTLLRPSDGSEGTDKKKVAIAASGAVALVLALVVLTSTVFATSTPVPTVTASPAHYCSDLKAAFTQVAAAITPPTTTTKFTPASEKTRLDAEVTKLTDAAATAKLAATEAPNPIAAAPLTDLATKTQALATANTNLSQALGALPAGASTVEITKVLTKYEPPVTKTSAALSTSRTPAQLAAMAKACPYLAQGGYFHTNLP